MRSKCINFASGCKPVTGNVATSNSHRTCKVQLFDAAFRLFWRFLLPMRSFDHFTISSLISDVIFEFSEAVFLWRRDHFWRVTPISAANCDDNALILPLVVNLSLEMDSSTSISYAYDVEILGTRATQLFVYFDDFSLARAVSTILQLPV